MKKQISILTVVFLLGSLKVLGCSCGYFGGFIYSQQRADVVVYGTVIEYDSIGTYDAPENPYSMKFLIKEKLRGIESRDTITVWGDYGADCRPYISHFKPKTNWILALNKLNVKGNEEYEISICGEFYVPVNDRAVRGKIFGWEYEQKEGVFDYDSIKKFILRPFDYLLQRPKKEIRKTKGGLEYMSSCDVLPYNTLPYDVLNKIVNERIKIPAVFMSKGDSHLIHIRAIIECDGKFHFNGTYGLNKSRDLISIENQVARIIEKTGTWHSGFEANKSVSSELIIPILLKR
ncbi:hypothetical protein EMN47_20365 [Prolixibacteraceae bacterium JC049]|nr:hypothetical protein [Prolixibacteraceae bacterium JC049]